MASSLADKSSTAQKLRGSQKGGGGVLGSLEVVTRQNELDAAIGIIPLSHCSAGNLQGPQTSLQRSC